MRRYENVKIEKLKPYENNARTHSEEQVEKISRSIKEFGFINPVLIDSNFGIIAGHGRVLGAKKLGMKEVPCLFVEDLTDEQKRAYILADNKLALDAGWDDEILREEIKALADLDFDVSLTGFELEDFDFNQTDIEFEEDNYDVEEKLPEIPKAKYGDIYQLGNHRIMCGDSTSQEDIDKLLDGAVMDLCVTDPPYNVNYGSINESGYGKERDNGNKILNDNMDDESFYLFLKAFYTQMMRVLKPGGAYYIFHADTEGYNFRKALMDAGGQVKQNLIWVKNALVLGRQDYQWKHEPCLYGWKEGAGHYFINDRTQTTVFEDKADLDKLSKEELKDMIKEIIEDKTPTTIIHEDKPLKNDVHPTMKPIKLISRLVKNSSKPGENVIDFFGGSGSTLIACEHLGRNCYSIELDPKYVDVIIDRWETLTGKTAIKLVEGIEMVQDD
jgi:site-specific DNA-methyltransferase (adenine-specific)